MRILLSLFAVSILQATPTQIVDVLYQPNGNPPAVAALTDITITQTAFVSGNNYYPAFELSPHPVSDASGNFSIWLEPNPAGQPYTILYRATNGIITHEFWTVPVSVTPLKIKDVRTSVGPLPPLGIVQLSQLAQGGALLNNVIAWNGLQWLASPLGTLGLEVTANKDQASGYAGLTAGTFLKTAEFPAFTGDCTTSAGTVAINCTNAIARTGVDINTSNQVTATHLSSALPVNQGGQGNLTLAAHGLLIGEGTSAVNVTSPGTAGQVLTSNGASADPTFQPAAGGGLTPSGFYLTSSGVSYCGALFQICTPASGVTIQNNAGLSGTSSVISSGGTQVLKVAGGGTGFNGVIAGKAIAAGNTSLTIALDCSPFSTLATTGTPLCGVAFGDGTAKAVSIYNYFNPGVSAAPGGLQTAYWSNQNTISASLTTGSGLLPGPGFSIWYVKLSCSVAGCASGTITIQAGNDPTNFSQGYTENATAHFASGPTYWGALGNSGSTDNDLYLRLHSFKVLP